MLIVLYKDVESQRNKDQLDYSMKHKISQLISISIMDIT